MISWIVYQIYQDSNASYLAQIQAHYFVIFIDDNFLKFFNSIVKNNKETNCKEYCLIFFWQIILTYLRIIDKIKSYICLLVVTKYQTYFIGFLIAVLNKEKLLLLNVIYCSIILPEFLLKIKEYFSVYYFPFI